MILIITITNLRQQYYWFKRQIDASVRNVIQYNCTQYLLLA